MLTLYHNGFLSGFPDQPHQYPGICKKCTLLGPFQTCGMRDAGHGIQQDVLNKLPRGHCLLKGAMLLYTFSGGEEGEAGEEGRGQMAGLQCPKKELPPVL